MSVVLIRFRNGESAFGRIQDVDQCDGKARTTIRLYDNTSRDFTGFLMEYWEEDVFTSTFAPDGMTDDLFKEEVLRMSKESEVEAERRQKLAAMQPSPGRILRPQ